MDSSQTGEDVQEEIKSRFRLAYDFAWQMISFGPVLATKMSIYSTISLPWGLGAAGAETVKQGVDSENADGVARMTATMVRLGVLGMVHDIVVSLCAQDRPDAVAAVTAELLTQGEVWVVIQITNALVASSHVNYAANISGCMIQQGNTQILEVLKEVGLDLSGGTADQSTKDQDKKEDADDSNDQSTSSQDNNGGVLASIQQQAASALERLTPNSSHEQQEGSQAKKTPDADALFSDWTGVKSPDGKGAEDKGSLDSPDGAPKPSRLL